MATTQIFTITVSPHIFTKHDLKQAMRYVIIALMPALVGAVYFFGWRPLILVLISVVTALAFEAFGQKIFGRKVDISDGSAIITGILLAYNLPPLAPYWLAVVGSGFAILIAKQFFGGLGYNFVNPALAGRAFLMASWPTFMTTAWSPPRGGTISGIDAVTQATPMTLLRSGGEIATQLNSPETIFNLFIGRVGGCVGETSAVLLIAGGLFLLIMKIIDYRIVTGYLSTCALLSFLVAPRISVLVYLFSGGLMLGAFFMATDWVTSPVTKPGRWIFGVGCGILTFFIRFWGGYPEGVSYAILIMNLWVPLIDRYTRGRSLRERSLIGERRWVNI